MLGLISVPRVHRAYTTVSHTGAGLITTNVDLTALRLPPINRCYERLLGFLATSGLPADVQVRLRLTSSINLEIITFNPLAGPVTIKVSWTVIIPGGAAYVERGVTSQTTNATTGQASTSVSITSVGSLAGAMEVHNGTTNTSGATGRIASAIGYSSITALLVEAYSPTGSLPIATNWCSVRM